MSVRVTAYAYPWDVARLGVERTLREMAAQGIDAIDLAATYHPIDALSPRDGTMRLFTSARGAVHFPARSARYGRIRPSMSSPEVCAVWPEVAARAPALGLAVNAWTVVLYQPWIVDAYPDCARVLPSGDRIGSGVCAANGDVHDYVVTLCEDIVDQFGVNMLRLEGVMAAGYDYGWLRPRVLVDVPPLARELLALCFCGSCTWRATAAGLDVERVRRLVTDAIDAELSDGATAGGADRAAGLVADAELNAFVVLHARASIELVRAVMSRFDSTRAPQVSTMPWMPYSSLLGAAQDEVFEEFVGVFDQLVALRVWGADRTRRVAAMASRSAHPVELATLLTPARPGAYASIVPTTAPAESAKDAEQVASRLKAAAALGVEEVNLYNYGLLRERDVRDFVAAVRTTFS
jgi:hypothetical protein